MFRKVRDEKHPLDIGLDDIDHTCVQTLGRSLSLIKEEGLHLLQAILGLIRCLAPTGGPLS